LISKHSKDTLINAKITIDRQGGIEFENWLSTYIKKGMNGEGIKRIKKVIMQDSHRYNLLQLADYIVGIVHRHYDEEKFIKVDYLTMIQNKCIKIIIRP
jgi:uncharacterized protein YeeX (DUF496 family)